MSFDQTGPIALRVENLSKRYALFQSPMDRIRQSLDVRARRLFGRTPPARSNEFSALTNVSFEIPKGHTVGVVGRNGSGKSTLLQIICGTLTPTSGSVEVDGRIAALLQLGAGFNPDYSGLDNVFLNAAILGMSRKETEARLDDILSFADIGRFINQPVKTYSSGMFVRLAFATAINSDPDILIIDEALAVGDEAFQRKCFARIHHIQDSGSTILFVSHSAQSVIELCDHALLLDAGELIVQGDPKEVTAQYQKLVHAPAEKQTGIRQMIKASSFREIVDEVKNPEKIQASPSAPISKTVPDHKDAFDPNFVSKSTVVYEQHGASISNVRIINKAGEPRNLLSPREFYFCEYWVKFSRPIQRVKFAMAIKTVSGFEIYSPWSHGIDDGVDAQENQTFRVRIPFHSILLKGTYFVNAGVFVEENGSFSQLHRVVDATIFRILPDSQTSKRFGVVDLEPKDESGTRTEIVSC